MKKMKMLGAIVVVSLSFFAAGATNGDESDSRPLADKATAKVIETRTEKILSYFTGQTDELPEEVLATTSDIPEIEYREAMIQGLRDEVARLRDSLTSAKSSFEKIQVFEPYETRGLTIASVEIWGRESPDGELESRTLEWVKTSNGEWKLLAP